MTEIKRQILPLVIFIALFVSFLISKLLIYAVIPFNSINDWIIRDTVMDLPRFIIGAITLFLGLRLYGAKVLGFNKSGFYCTVLGLFLMLLQLTLISRWCIPLTVNDFPVLGLLIFSSFLVGFFEEILFRGLAYAALREYFGVFTTLLISTTFFTAIHFFSHEFIEFPALFITGLLFGYMRAQGISLWWLSLMHGLVDSLWIVWLGNYSGEESWIAIYVSVFLTLLIYVAITGGFRWLLVKPPERISLFSA